MLSAAFFLSLASASRVAFETDVPVYSSKTSSWVKIAKAKAQQQMRLTVALKVDESRRANLERHFWEVSDPDHRRYGKFLTVDEITGILAVPQAQVARVQNHFAMAGATVTEVNNNRDMITVTMPVEAAELALDTKIHVFAHKKHKNVQIMRASQGYSLPAEIAGDVTMVGELLQFPRMRDSSLNNLQGAGTWPNACDSSSCQGLITPAVLAQRYKLPNSSALTAVAGNSMAVAEFQGQYFVPTDLTTFGTSCHRDVSVAAVIGGNSPSPGIEAELDIEYIRSVAPSVPLTVVYNAEYSLLNWANQITNNQSSPFIHSVSYGNDEAQQTSTGFMYTANTAFMKAGARGLSILFASGDQGVCGREGCGFIKKSFKPDFPGGSPYITVVGGTDFAGTGGVIGDEQAWSNGGGGFSNTFAIPDYQSAAVAAYKANPSANLPKQDLWNNTGRGYPDIAALGGQKAPYCIATGGRFTGVAGTSASCPVAAGVFALVNGLRIAAGKSQLGFLNPFIYKNPTAFQDVTQGSNPGNGDTGFNAIQGWDAATGFGTPDYEAIAKAAMAIP